MSTKGDKFYGYEDYNLTRFSASIFNDPPAWSAGKYSQYYQGREYYTVMPIDQSLLGEERWFYLNIDNHPELLKTAKKLYIHPNCTVPRDAVAKKFKKCLNPYEADAVVIPDTIIAPCISTENWAVFINHEHKTIYATYIVMDSQYYSKIFNAPGGTTIGSLITAPRGEYPPFFEESKLEYVGPIHQFPRAEAHLMDYMTFKMPKDKIVFQKDLLDTLGDESNVPTVEALVSIYEMLKSNDESVKEMGLKTLATLDYYHYPETFISLIKAGDIRWNNARNASAVKCMLETLKIGGGSSLNWIKHTKRFISHKDYELFEKVMKSILNYNYDSYCEGISFMYMNDYLQPTPRFID